MKLRRITIPMIAVFIFAWGVIASAMPQAKQEEKDQVLKMSQVPQKVQQALKAYASEAEVKKITMGDVDGTKAYEFEIEKAGRKSEVAITPDGKVLATEEIIPLAEVPDAARQAITAKAASGKVVSVEKVFENGKTAYEGTIERAGKQFLVVVAQDGKVVGSEEDVALADVPAAARKTIEAKAAGGTIVSLKKVLEDGKTVFAAVIEKGGKRTEIAVAPDGKIVDTEEIKH